MVKTSKLIFHKTETVPISKVEVWEEAEARRLDEEGIKELAESIKEEGLQNPPLVQKGKDGMYRVIAGQRRLAALRKLGTKNIPVLVVNHQFSIDDAKAVSIIENLHRKQMKPREMAEACDFLVKSLNSTRKAAKALGITQRTLRSYVGFSSIPEKLQQLVPEVLSRNEAVRLYRIVPNVEEAIEIANRLKRYTPEARRRYLDALEMDPKAPHAVLKRMASHFKEKQKVRIKLTAQQAKSLAKASSDNAMEPNELAAKIITDWLTKKGYR